MSKITYAQLWYLTRVYPESISEREAQQSWDDSDHEQEEQSFFESAAKIVNNITNAD